MAESRDLAEFNLVYGQADSLVKGFPEAQFKTVAALFVIIGWLLTANTAQAFIRSHASVLLPATIAAMAMLVLFKALWIYGYYRRVQVLHSRLILLGRAQGFSLETVDVFSAGPVVPVTFFLVNAVVCASIVCVVRLICA